MTKHAVGWTCPGCKRRYPEEGLGCFYCGDYDLVSDERGHAFKAQARPPGEVAIVVDMRVRSQRRPPKRLPRAAASPETRQARPRLLRRPHPETTCQPLPHRRYIQLKARGTKPKSPLKLIVSS